MWRWLAAVAGAADPVEPIDLFEPGDDVEEPASLLPTAPLEMVELPGTGAAVLELTAGARSSGDVEVFVRYDGNLYYGDLLVLRADLERMLSERLAVEPEARVVISGDTGAPYEALVYVVRTARELGAKRTALTIAGLEASGPVDPLFPGVDTEVETLGGGLTGGQLQVLRPKRHKFPQNPYGNTASYTAYTLERGETKIGPASITTGILPRVQLGTAELLDFVGAVNLNVKANLTREGPFDGALLAQYYYVPLGGLLKAAGAGDWFDGRNGGSTTVHASYVGLGATGSLTVLPPWSLHAQLYWARPSARGDMRFDDLPEVLLPGLSLGNTAMVGLGVTGDLAVVNLASDLRFNRRDSVFAWVRYPFYGRVRGLTSGAVDGIDAIENTDLIVAYGDTIGFGQSYSIAAGYQGSWKHVEARVGLGVSAVKLTWLFQAFEVSYKFGGTTRRMETRIRRGYGEMPSDP